MLLGRVTAVEQIAILCWIYLSAATMSGSPRGYASGYRRLSRSNEETVSRALGTACTNWRSPSLRGWSNGPSL